MINVDSLIIFVKPYYENKDIMHDLSHINRVLKYVGKILTLGNYKADLDILTYSAYFHGFVYNSEQRIIGWLKSQNISADNIDKVIKVSWESQKDKAMLGR